MIALDTQGIATNMKLKSTIFLVVNKVDTLTVLGNKRIRIPENKKLFDI